ncbi:DUF6247 family protein [Streptomyces sp. NBC_01506]|uniref:DUF6247 family protein n=1 Tax=Streptomyces sp. NBC_01506 TaxID=2903887 RepID=UPI0038705D65
MPLKVDLDSCERTPGAIRAALARKPEWLQSFEQEFLSAAADFDQDGIHAVVAKWHPHACACATPGYLDEVEDLVRRTHSKGDDSLVFWDADGSAFDAEGNPLAGSRSPAG